jgi:serine/threonine protein kinase
MHFRGCKDVSALVSVSMVSRACADRPCLVFVRSFDFGLAKEIDPDKQDASGMYKLTGDTGSPRYMAPEVALEKPYNELVDVYSFSVLLWQILMLETPFEGFSMSMFNKKVIKEGARPKCDPKWPTNIIDLMQRGWGEPRNRPSMSDVASTLHEEISRHMDMNEFGNDLLDASRKSELSLRGDRSMNKSELSARAISSLQKNR